MTMTGKKLAFAGCAFIVVIAAGAWALAMFSADPVGAVNTTATASITYPCNVAAADRIITTATINGLKEKYSFAGTAGRVVLSRDYLGSFTVSDCTEAAETERAALLSDGWTTSLVAPSILNRIEVHAAIDGDHSNVITAVSNVGARLATAPTLGS